MNASDHQFVVTSHHIKALIAHALKNTYKTKDADREADTILKNCISLFGKDYKYSLLDNRNGDLCGHYPSQLVLLEYLKCDDTAQSSHQSIYDIKDVRELVSRAKSARCRQRFAFPVMLYEDKHICRGATISGGAEMYGRQLCDMFSGANSNVSASAAQGNYVDDTTSDGQMHTRVRGQDIRLLKHFNIGFIFDLMLERKKVKFGMNVTSSEKVDKENRYADFQISSVPYPGCEFFRIWKDSGYRAEGLYFDWNQDFVDSRLELPVGPSPPCNIEWSNYRNWDLVTLTQNYLKLLLHYIKDGDSGILIHCISGWDRTPLFVSLVRLSLWAEGLAHPSLSATEILYLTIAYDWFLFGHNFPDRISQGEEVFFFCFTFLKYMTSDEFNVSRRRGKRTVSTADSDNFIDGILFDGARNGSSRGSNSSISSISSFSSTRSNAEQPVHFSVGSADDDLVLIHNMQTSSSTLKVSPSNRCTDHTGSYPVSTSARCTGSSPMPVPRAVQRLASDLKVTSVASCGSWQMVSGCESFRGVSSPADSSRSHSGSSSHDVRETLRRQRLDDVRHTFIRTYTSVLNTSSTPTSDAASAGAMLTGLLERVGLRTAYSGFI